jgi:phosphatidylinositol alpha 1,6-mannosyltransferase
MGSNVSDLSGLRLALFTDTFHPQVNGVARTLARLCDAVRARGGEVRVFTTADAQAQPHPDTVRFPSRAFWAYPELQLAWPSNAAVADSLRAFNPTLVHAATEFGVGLAGRRAARALGVPFVSSYHTSFTAYAGHYGLGLLARPGWAYLRWFHNSGLRTYCPTRAIVDDVSAQGFERCAVWSRGVDAERFSPAYRSNAFRERLGADAQTLVVSYVGRLAAEKGLDVAIGAMHAVAESHPGALRCLFVGDGPYEHTARNAAPAGSTFTGKLEGHALSEAYASSDLLIFPSTTDTFGNVMLEAMASGVPVLAADVGPSREVVPPGTGWLAAAGDPGAFADVLRAAVRERNEVIRRGLRAREVALSRSWGAIWDTLFSDYLTLHAAA